MILIKKFLQKLAFGFSVLVFFIHGAIAETPYDMLQSKADSLRTSHQTEAWAYLISGAVALGVSTPGFYLSKDFFAKSIYTLGQTLGAGAVGYGVYLMLVKSEPQRFRDIVENTPDLSPAQKNVLAEQFILENGERGYGSRMIRLTAHSLIAILNLANSFAIDNSEIRTALYFLGGVNALAALNFALTRSDEEEQADKIRTMKAISQTGVTWNWILGPMAGIQIHF